MCLSVAVALASTFSIGAKALKFPVTPTDKSVFLSGRRPLIVFQVILVAVWVVTAWLLATSTQFLQVYKDVAADIRTAESSSSEDMPFGSSQQHLVDVVAEETYMAGRFNSLFFNAARDCYDPGTWLFWSIVDNICPDSMHYRSCLRCYYFSNSMCGADELTCMEGGGNSLTSRGCAYGICRVEILEYLSDTAGGWFQAVLSVILLLLAIIIILNLTLLLCGGPSSVVPSSQDKKAPGAAVWQTKLSKSTGKTYWYNVVTGESTWVKPADESIISGDGDAEVDAVAQQATIRTKVKPAPAKQALAAEALSASVEASGENYNNYSNGSNGTEMSPRTREAYELQLAVEASRAEAAAGAHSRSSNNNGSSASASGMASNNRVVVNRNVQTNENGYTRTGNNSGTNTNANMNSAVPQISPRTKADQTAYMQAVEASKMSYALESSSGAHPIIATRGTGTAGNVSAQGAPLF